MGKANFSDEFKRDAVAQITERGYPVAEVSKRLGVSPHSLYAWKKKFGSASGWLQAPAGKLWRQATHGCRQHAGPAVRRGHA